MNRDPEAREVLGIPPRLGVGVALLCDAQTIVRHVIRDDVGLPDRAEPRRSFASLVDPENGDKVRRFLGAITTHGVAFGWRITIPTHAGDARLHFAGTTTSMGLLIVGTPSAPALGAYCRELLDSGEEAVRSIRADLRALVMQAESAPTADQDVDDELHRLREELAEAHRELERRAQQEAARDGDRMAEALEQALLPGELPRHPRLSLDALRTSGARRPPQSRSWYDAFRLPDERIALVAASVAGAGPRALALMTEVRAAIRTLAFEGQSPFAVLTRADRVLRLSLGGTLNATAVLGVLDPAAMILTYSIAGHPAPILVASPGGSERLQGDGWSLGARVGELRLARTVRLPDHFLLVFHAGRALRETGADTVGIVSTVDTVDAVEAAARAELERGSLEPARDICRRLRAEAPPAEDLALLTVTVRPSS